MTGIPKPVTRTDAEVIERVRGRVRACMLCSVPAWREPLQAHHIVPRSHQRLDCEENIAMLCRECHGAVHGSAETRRMFLGLMDPKDRAFLRLIAPCWGGWTK
jgi:5-methylcytosine-specific restriction endonuclease McrA